MTESIINLSYKSCLDASENGLSRFDYFYMVRKDLSVHEDFIYIFSAIFNPKIIMRSGGLYIQENFTVERYGELLNNGLACSEIPYWLNMLELTDLLGEVSYDYAAELGEVVRECWASKLEKTFPNSGFEARLILEDDLEEVWVTLCELPKE